MPKMHFQFHPSLFIFSHLVRGFHRNSSDLDRTLKGLVISGRLVKAVGLLCRKGPSNVHPRTYALLLQEAINRKDDKVGRTIHGQMVARGFAIDEFLKVKLLIFYLRSGDFRTAHILFDDIPEPGAVPCNAMISGYVKGGLEEEGLRWFYVMQSFGVRPDQFTFPSVFRACARLAKLEHGRLVHGTMIKVPVVGNVVVTSALVDMYLKCSSLSDGLRAFEELPERNVVTWTALITGLGQHGQVLEVLELFQRMRNEGVRPNYVTFLALLSACSHSGFIADGWKYFSLMYKEYGIQPRGEHIAVMVDLLGRAGQLDEAYELIQKYPSVKHPSVWGALLGACRKHFNMRLLRIASKNFFELAPENAGKYIVLSNTFAASEMWKDVLDVRKMFCELGIRKEPGWSAVEVQGMIHVFLVGDKSHEQNEMIEEVMKGLSCALVEAGRFADLDNQSLRKY